MSAFVWAYLATVIGLGLIRGRGLRAADLRLPDGLGIALSAALTLPALYFVIEDRAALFDNAQLPGLVRVLEDRAHQREDPALHPRVLRLDQPQVVWIRAEGARAVSLRLEDLDLGPARAIGPGVFRLRFDPPALPAGPAVAVLTVDGTPHRRAVELTGTLARPEDLRPAPGGASVVLPEADAVLRLTPGGIERLPVGDGPVAAVFTATCGYVAHRADPFLWRTRPAPAPHLRVGLDQADLDLDLDGRRLAVAVRSPPAVHVGPPDGPLVPVVLPAAPDRVRFVGEALVVASRTARRLFRLRRGPAGWSVDRPPLVLGRPVTALTARDTTLFVAVSDLRPNDDAGANHHVHEQLLAIDVERWQVIGRRAVFEPGEGLACAGIVHLTATKDSLHGVCEGTDALFSLSKLDGEMALSASRFAAPSGLVRAGPNTYEVSWATARVSGMNETQPAPQAALRDGARAFTEATRSGVSCATCHPRADSDHAMHDIGHGVPRPTLSVRGLAGTSPFLRGASYPTLAGLDHFARTILGDYARPAPERAHDLEAFVLALPPPFVPGRLTASEADLQNGYAAFRKAGCNDCHPAPVFSDLSQIPQQVLFPERPAGVLLDTPSLVGVAATPPYLFDGRARSLPAVFDDHDPGRRHGAIRALDAHERADLFRFLESL